MNDGLSELGRAALWYVEHGFAIIPLWPRAKTPRTKGGLKDWTDDSESVREIWTAYPDSNIGIVCGEPSGGLVVIDLDVHEDLDGNDVRRTWEKEHGDLPETCAAVTGSGGTHLLYRSREPVRPSVNAELAVDVRGEGSYIVAPPSVHPSGTRYEWEVPPEELEPQRLDGNARAFIAHVQPASSHDGIQHLELAGTIGEGGRNDALYRLGCSLRAKHTEPSIIADTMRGVNAARCNPPIPADELEKTIASVLALPEGRSKAFEEVKAKAKAESKSKEIAPGEPSTAPTVPDQATDAQPAFMGELAAQCEHLRSVGAMTKKGGIVHNVFARLIIEDEQACKIETRDGAPAVWVGDRYEMGWGAVDRAITMHYDGATKTQRSEIREYIAIMAPVHQPSPPNLVAFKNGVLDITTGEFGPMQRGMVIPNVIQTEWVPGAASRDWAPAVDDVIAKISRNDVTMQVNLYETLGMCMYRSNDFAQVPILLGGGSNGKSTFLKMLKSTIGGENYSALDIGMLDKNQFQVGMLAGKLANIGDDISNSFLKGNALSLFKKIASGDDVYTDTKGTQGYHFKPYCTMIFSANEFPKLEDSSEGVMRRLFPIEFRARFSRSDPDFDPHINEKLATDRAKQRCAFLGMVGLASVIQQNGFTPNAAADAVRNRIRTENDTVLQWLEDTCTGELQIVGQAIGVLYSDYSEWAKEGGYNPVGRSKFTQRINAVFDTKSENKRLSDGTCRCTRCFVKV